MTPIAYLIFDLDGTISDPFVGIARCMNYALEYFGYSPISEDCISQFIGPPLDYAFRSVIGPASPDQVAELVDKYRERYAEVGYSENVLYPGIPEVLSVLSTAEVPLGLCTSKRVDFAENILKMFGLRHYFKFLSGGDIGVHKSQQLAALLKAGTISGASFMIGDRAVDIEAARKNGLASVGVLWGHGTEEELRLADPTYTLRHPNQLAELRYAL
ncbi:MAG TPA: HAD hydrolase-like protein [Thermodesulfobacteriota bacterium]|nr:HAD hydrolase-like protein [Thermodesulfobacteriota bacterium]